MIYDFKALGNYFKLDFDIELDKDQQVYCFIGENGIGKTRLLQTFANVLIGSSIAFLRSDESNFQLSYNNSLPFSKIIQRDSSLNDYIKDLTIHYPQDLMINNAFKNHDLYKNGYTKLNCDTVISPIIRPSYGFVCSYPVIFVSAKNRGYINGLNDSRILSLDGSSSERFIRSFLHTYNSLYNQDVTTDSITNWILQRLVMQSSFISGVDRLSKEVTFVLECLNKFAPELNILKYDENNKPVINCSYENGDFYIAGIAIQNLSTGYASILRIIQEIVAGLSDWDNNVDLHNADGIVFIDEIDLHLHPKWQFKIIDWLKEFFPKVTFYITTHSPLVLFNLKNGEGYKLNKDDKNLVTAEKIEQTNMQFIGDIMKQFFEVDGVSVRKTDKQSMMQARKNLLDLIKDNQDEE